MYSMIYYDIIDSYSENNWEDIIITDLMTKWDKYTFEKKLKNINYCLIYQKVIEKK